MRTRLVAAFAAVVVVLTGCAGSSDSVDPGDPDQVEVLSWWASGNEETSFHDLLQVFEADHPEVEFFDASVAGRDGSQARAALAARLQADNPPDSFQAAGGAGLAEYIEAGQVADLADWYAEHRLNQGVFRADLLALLGTDGGPFAVPIDIHRVNVVWADTSLLVSAGIDPNIAPPSIDAWVADLERIRASGVSYPLALGDAWTQLQLFEAVLIANFDPNRYKDLWSHLETWDSTDLESAIADYGRLLEFADPQATSREWNVVTQEVVQSRAAYVLMADFAEVPFREGGLTYGKQYTSFPAPGTQGVFDLLVDSFALSAAAAHREAGEKWLLTVSSPAGQTALSIRKGSIPARLDIDETAFPPYQRSAITSSRSDVIVPSLTHGVAASADWIDAIRDAVSEFRIDGHPQALANALRTAATAAGV